MVAFVLAVGVGGAARVEAEELPPTVAGLLGMACFDVERAIEAAGGAVESSPGSGIWESGAGEMRVRTMVVSGTGLFLYCDRGRVAGFAAGRAWGEELFDGVFPGFAPFDSGAALSRALGQVVEGSFARHGGDGGGTWVRGTVAVRYSLCLRC